MPRDVPDLFRLWFLLMPLLFKYRTAARILCAGGLDRLLRLMRVQLLGAMRLDLFQGVWLTDFLQQRAKHGMKLLL